MGQIAQTRVRGVTGILLGVRLAGAGITRAVGVAFDERGEGGVQVDGHDRQFMATRGG